jgi:hypothetical protein
MNWTAGFMLEIGGSIVIIEKMAEKFIIYWGGVAAVVCGFKPSFGRGWKLDRGVVSGASRMIRCVRMLAWVFGRAGGRRLVTSGGRSREDEENFS